MKLSICAVAALFLFSPVAALAQNNNLPALQTSFMSGSSSRSAAMQEQQKQLQRVKMQQMQGSRQGVGAGRANPGQPYGQQQQVMQQQQQQAGMPVQSMLNTGLPQVRTSRWCGMPGEDMVRNNVRSAAIQARNPKPVVRAKPQPQVPQGPTYSYSGGYDYQSNQGNQGK